MLIDFAREGLEGCTTDWEVSEDVSWRMPIFWLTEQACMRYLKITTS